MFIKEQIRIMERYLAGDTIAFFDLDMGNWIEICPNQEEYSFDFENYDYKVKPKELTLEDKINAKYPDYEVVMLEWDVSGYLLYTDEDCDQRRPHIEAQSMKGFYRYVFDFTGGKGGDLTTSLNVCCSVGGGWETLQPVAVLFEREK